MSHEDVTLRGSHMHLGPHTRISARPVHHQDLNQRFRRGEGLVTGRMGTASVGCGVPVARCQHYRGGGLGQELEGLIVISIKVIEFDIS